MERPKLKFKLKPVDYLMEIVGYLGLVLLIAVPTFYFNLLPDKLPSHFNSLGQSEENAKRLYSLAQRTIRLLKLIILYSFIYLNYKTIMIGLNKSIGIGSLYLPIFLTICFLLIGVMVNKTMKK